MGVAQQLALLTLLIVLLVQIMLTVACWGLPVMDSRGLFLGVTVSPDFENTPEAMDIIRRFRRKVVTLGVLAGMGALATAVAVLRWPEALFLALLVLTPAHLILLAWFYILARRRVLPHAGPESMVREALVRPRRVSLPGGWFFHAGPYLICLLAGLLALALADHMTWPRPMHWNIHGQVDAWAQRSTMNLLMPPLLGLCCCLPMTILTWLLTLSPQRGPQTPQVQQRHRLAFWIIPLVGYAMALSMAWLALAPAFLPPSDSPMGYLWPFFVLFPLVLLIVAVVVIRDMRREIRAKHSNRSGPPGDGTPDRCWKLGLIYYNPDDPAVMVPKRFGYGWTFNFARPLVWIVVVVISLILPAIQVIIIRATSGSPSPSSAASSTPAPPAFTNDPDVLGRWVSVDFVEKIDQFRPGARQSHGKLFLGSLTFEPSGHVDWQPGVPHVWTRGRVIMPDGPNALYEIRQLDGRPYLFMQWISGDVTLSGMEPKYYVLARDDAAATTQASESE